MTGDICYITDVLWTVLRAPVLPCPALAIVGASMFTAEPITPGFSMSYVTPPPPLQLPLLPPPPPPIQPPSQQSPPLQYASSPLAATLARPHKEPKRIPGRTCSKTVQVSDTPAHQLSTTPEKLPPSSLMTSDQGFNHIVGLLPMTNKSGLLSMLTIGGAVDAGRRKMPPVVGGDGQPSHSGVDREGTPYTGEPGGTPCALEPLLVAEEDIDTTIGTQQPPYKPPDLSHYYSSELKVEVAGTACTPAVAVAVHCGLRAPSAAGTAPAVVAVAVPRRCSAPSAAGTAPAAVVSADTATAAVAPPS